MKKQIFLFLITFITLCANAQTTPIHLTGTIKGLSGKEVVLLDADMKNRLATVKGKGDSFAIQADVVTNDGRTYYLYVPSLGELGPSMHIPYVFFFIDNKEVELEAEISNGNLKLTTMKGSPAMDEYKALCTANALEKKVEEAGKVYNEAFDLYNNKEQSEANRKKLDDASKQLDAQYQAQAQEYMKMIPAHNKSNAMFLIAYSNGGAWAESEIQIKEFLGQFDAVLLQTNYFALQLQQKLQLMKGCEVGQTAPDFELKDMNGNTVKLSSLRGQYVLIDFWASWCGPCRKEIPNLKKVYADYKEKGLKLVGVSIDSREADWRKAIAEEKLDYLQLWDAEKQTMKLYNYNGIPFIILVAPDGEILAKQLRGEELRQKVSEHLDSSSFKISVSLNELFKGKVYLGAIKKRLTYVDSLEVDGKEFTFTGKVPRPDRYRVISRPYGFDAEINVEPGGEYDLHIAGKRNYEVKVLKGQEQLWMNEFKNTIAPLEQKSEELGIAYSNEKNAAKQETLQKEMLVIFDRKGKASVEFIRQHPGSFASVVVASELLTFSYEDLQEVYKLMDTVKYADSYYMKSFLSKYREVTDKWIQNKKAPDFLTQTLDGKEVRLSDFKGHYLLLDFWASWCRPCRARALEIKKIIGQLEAKNIKVCGISMDDKRDQWEKATKEDGIIWTNTSELKKFNDNPIAADYKVTQLPTLFLIDPEGMIIKQNPSIDDLLQFKDN